MTQNPRRNPITPRNPRGAGQVSTGDSLSLKISGMPDGMAEHLRCKKSEYGSYGAYLKLLIEQDMRSSESHSIARGHPTAKEAIENLRSIWDIDYESLN